MIRQLRRTIYEVRGAFAVKGVQGVTATQRVDKNVLQFTLGMLDPFKLDEWMGTVDALPRRGTAIIRMTATNGNSMMEKVVAVTKC